jgi:ankyrin repeat protein
VIASKKSEPISDYYGADLFKCPQSGCFYSKKGFATGLDRDSHARCHARPFKCDDVACQYHVLGFYSASVLAKHMTLHADLHVAMDTISNLHISAEPEDVLREHIYDSMMLEAITADNVPQLQRALRISGRDLNYIIDRKNSILGLAAKANSLKVAEFLLSNSAMVMERAPDDIDADRPTPALHFAVRNGSFEMAKLLLDYGADVNYRSYHGVRSPMEEAIDQRSKEMASLLIDYGAETSETSVWHDSPLVYAAKKGALDIVSLLLDHGVDPNEENAEDHTALTAAASGGPSTVDRAKILKVLLEAGADPEAMGVCSENVGCALTYPISVLMKKFIYSH